LEKNILRQRAQKCGLPVGLPGLDAKRNNHHRQKEKIMLIETINDGFINLHQAKRIRRLRYNKEDRSCSMEFEMMDGTLITSKVWRDKLEQIEYAHKVVMPAQPGFMLLICYSEGEKVWIVRSPLIAWLVDPFRDNHKAIGLDMAASNVLTDGILCPDGRVIDLTLGHYNNEEEWLKECREIVEKRKKASA
jgi:hypothetical protein